MKICWDNLNKIKFTKNRTFRSLNGKHCYIEKNNCKCCGHSYLDRTDINSDYCSNSCVNTGKKISKDTREKISKSLSGKFIGELNPFYGKKHTNKTKIKWINNARHVGENNHNWKGGKSFEPYCADWTKEYKRFIKERDGFMCLNPYCFGLSDVLTIHHIDYDKKNCNTYNLITVCNSCNSRANIDREWHESWYTTIMERRYNG